MISPMSERKSPLPPGPETPAERPVRISERPTLPPKPEQREEEGKLLVQADTAARYEHEGKKENQDKYLELVSKDGRAGLFVVADGMGGRSGGEVASSITVETFEKYFSKLEEIRERRAQGDPQATVQSEAELLKRAMREADQAVKNKREDILAYGQMGTTCVATRLTIDENGEHCVIVASVGDSRVYLSHPDGELETLTLDDNMALIVTEKKHGVEAALRVQDILDNSLGQGQLEILMEVVKKNEAFPAEGILSKEDIRFLMDHLDQNWFKYYHANSARVFNTVGDGVDVHMRTVPLEPGSKLILSSDGTDGLLRDEIALIASGRADELSSKGARLAAQSWPDNSAKALVKAAKERQKETKPPHLHLRSRGFDDTTVVAVTVPKR